MSLDLSLSSHLNSLFGLTARSDITESKASRSYGVPVPHGLWTV